MKTRNKVLDRTFWLYVILGLFNYGLCSVVMLVLHNVYHVSKDASIIIEFALQTSISFLLNRFVTFRGIRISRWWPVKFFVAVGVSYLLAKVLLLKLFEYLITLPFFISIADRIQGIAARDADPLKFRQNLVMLACTFAYCVINYIGQRYYVFRPRKEE